VAVAIAEVLTYANGTAAEPTASLGAGSAIDDYCVAALSVLTTVTAVAASGWSEEAVTNNSVSTLCQTRIYKFRLTSAGAQSHAFDRGGSSRWSLAVVRMTGVDTTTAIDAGDQTGSGTAAESHTSPSVACDAGNMALGFASMRVFPNNSWTLTAGGFSEEADFRGTDGSTNFRIGVFSKQSSGATEQYTVATSAGDGEPALKALFEIAAAAGGGSEITGTAAASLGALTATAVGTPTTFGTAASALGTLAGTAAGVRTVLGAATANLGALTSSAAGLRQISGVCAAPLGALVATTIGGIATAGVANVNLGALVATAAGTVRTPVAGTAAAALGALIGAAPGSVGAADARATSTPAVTAGRTSTAAVTARRTSTSSVTTSRTSSSSIGG
jgi:hypothetical protein